MAENEALGVGGPYRDPKPDCTNGGSHRYGQGHFLPHDSKRSIQYCRRCGEPRMLVTGIENGSIIERVIDSPSEK